MPSRLGARHLSVLGGLNDAAAPHFFRALLASLSAGSRLLLIPNELHFAPQDPVFYARPFFTYLRRCQRAAALADPARAGWLVAFVTATVRAYLRSVRHPRAATYLSVNVRFKGIWYGWRDAGLQHLPDAVVVRFCGFPKAIVF